MIEETITFQGKDANKYFVYIRGFNKTEDITDISNKVKEILHPDWTISNTLSQLSLKDDSKELTI